MSDEIARLTNLKEKKEYRLQLLEADFEKRNGELDLIRHRRPLLPNPILGDEQEDAKTADKIAPDFAYKLGRNKEVAKDIAEAKKELRDVIKELDLIQGNGDGKTSDDDVETSTKDDPAENAKEVVEKKSNARKEHPPQTFDVLFLDGRPPGTMTSEQLMAIAMSMPHPNQK